jgi:hypothetical protein
MQPSIIYMDRAEKTFLKKVSKTDKSDPKRLKKDLPRLVRSLTSEDRVMLIGVSRSPWECEQKVISFGFCIISCFTFRRAERTFISGFDSNLSKILGPTTPRLRPAAQAVEGADRSESRRKHHQVVGQVRPVGPFQGLRRLHGRTYCQRGQSGTPQCFKINLLYIVTRKSAFCP